MERRLRIHVVEANLVHDTDMFLKMDPYTVIKVGSQKQKTRVIDYGGKKPTWNETFEFRVTGGEGFIEIKVMDKDTFTADDVIGSLDIPMYTLLNQSNKIDHWYDLEYKRRYAGKLHLIIEPPLSFMPPNIGNGFGTAQPQVPYGAKNLNKPFAPMKNQPSPQVHQPGQPQMQFQNFGYNTMNQTNPNNFQPQPQMPIPGYNQDAWNRGTPRGAPQGTPRINEYPTPPPGPGDDSPRRLELKKTNSGEGPNSQTIAHHLLAMGKVSPFLAMMANNGAPQPGPSSQGLGNLPPGFLDAPPQTYRY